MMVQCTSIAEMSEIKIFHFFSGPPGIEMNSFDTFKVNNNEESDIFDVSCETPDNISDKEGEEEKIPLMRVAKM